MVAVSLAPQGLSKSVPAKPRPECFTEAAARASATWLNRYRCSRGVKAADQAPVVTRQRQHNTTLPATVANSCSLLRACHTVQLVRKGPPPQAIAHHPPNSQHGSPPLLTRIVVTMEYRNAGRLGNMMFLYAAGFGMACHSGVRLMLTNSNRSRSFCNAFPAALACDSAMHNDPDMRPWHRIENELWHNIENELLSWQPRPWWPLHPGLNRVGGYRQSPAYWEGCHTQSLRDQFRFAPAIQDAAAQLLRAHGLVVTSIDGQTPTAQCGSVYARFNDSTGDGYFDCHPTEAFYSQALPRLAEMLQARGKPKWVFLTSSYASTPAQREALYAKGSREANASVVAIDHRNPAVVMFALSMCGGAVFNFGSFSWWASFLTGGPVVFDATLTDSTKRRWCSSFHHWQPSCGRDAEGFVMAHLPSSWTPIGRPSGHAIRMCAKPRSRLGYSSLAEPSLPAAAPAFSSAVSSTGASSLVSCSPLTVPALVLVLLPIATYAFWRPVLERVVWPREPC